MSKRPTQDVVLVVHPGSELYGSDRMMVESVRSFIGRGFRVRVLLPHDGPLVLVLQDLGARCDVMAMPVLRKASLSPRGLLALALSTARWLPNAMRMLQQLRPSLLYVSTQIIPAWVLLGRLTGTPTVCHVHEAERHPSRLVEKALVLPLLAAERVVANSRYSAGVIEAVVPRVGRKTTVVYNGVTGPREVKHARRDITSPVRLVYVGRLSPRKGPDVALAALRELRNTGVDATLDVVGSIYAGYEWFEDQLRTEYLTEVKTGAVIFRGFHPEVWTALADADIALVPSTLPEPFGNTAVEAELAGRPLVVSDIGGLPEAVQDNPCARVVLPGDSAALAEAVRSLMADWRSIVPLLEVARVGAGERFAVERYGRDLIAAVAPVTRRG